ncbi:coiled-coil domain-containing protein 27 [Discoglossus pictus]
MVTGSLANMKEGVGLKMEGIQELQFSGNHRPRTAGWRVPKTDNRREKYSRSARDTGHSCEIHSPLYSSSPVPSCDNNNGSHIINLHMSNGTSSGYPKSSNLSAVTCQIEGKLPVIHSSTDLPKCNMSTDRSTQYNGNQTYLTSVEIKTPWYITMLHDKERNLLKLGEEINRLSKYEVESKRKDEIISILKDEITQLQREMCQASQRNSLKGDPEAEQLSEVNTLHEEDFTEQAEISESLHSDLSINAEDLSAYMSEINNESHVMHMETEPSLIEDNFGDEKISYIESGVSFEDNTYDYLEIPDDLQKITELKEELQNCKKDCEICKGTISSLQRQLSFQESQLSKSQAEKENLQKQLIERGLQIQAMTAKFSSMRDERKHEDMIAANEKENQNLRELVSELKSEVTKRNDLIANFKTEVHKLQKELIDNQLRLKKCDRERSEIQSKAEKLVFSEQRVKVSLESIQSRFERFRNKILQATYTAPGVKNPHVELTDNELLDAMQKIIMERSDYHDQLKQSGVKVPSLYTDHPSLAKQSSSTTRKKAQ